MLLEKGKIYKINNDLYKVIEDLLDNRAVLVSVSESELPDTKVTDTGKIPDKNKFNKTLVIEK